MKTTKSLDKNVQGVFVQSRYSIIDLSALAYNYAAVQHRVGSAKIMAIVKANAYGHGLVEVSQFLQKQGVNYFGVAFIEEAITLRHAGITLPILVLGGVMIEQIPLFLEYNIDIMASSIEKLQAIAACAILHKMQARVHLKIDTGLGRIGVRDTNAYDFFSYAVGLSSVHIIGVASHFATSDDPDNTYMREQCLKFERATQFFPDHGLPMPLRHIANSGAIMQFPESYFDMVRPGIMLYGVYPQSWMKKICALRPVLSLYARVVYFKVVCQSVGISYGLSWKAPETTRIITLPVGYGDGYPRALSNKGYVLMQGVRYNIVGNICMDQMMIDIKKAQAYCGNEVVLIGKSGEQEITINDLVDCYEGSAYEFLVLLNARIARQYRSIDFHS